MTNDDNLKNLNQSGSICLLLAWKIVLLMQNRSDGVKLCEQWLINQGSVRKEKAKTSLDAGD